MNSNFVQIVKQTHEEKVAMYMKCKKKELAEMLATRDDYDEINPSTANNYYVNSSQC
jgi:hypothetical protein